MATRKLTFLNKNKGLKTQNLRFERRAGFFPMKPALPGADQGYRDNFLLMVSAAARVCLITADIFLSDIDALNPTTHRAGI